ncbi:collagen alpha-6(VI) chain-like [Ruditapes philippinarum]|uniref:collagen alpha-6(VI) chain-like n=1 Tax=Ruditapes philippinarum TaxID=129788 RepID=UPI00295B84B0|nr:collagen alpha-6(VI) chain-like [Ruditapes philippinarum]
MEVLKCLILAFIAETTARSCNKGCEWSPWKGWSGCSRTCGGGFRSRYRPFCCRSDLASDIDACLSNCGKDLSFLYSGEYLSESCMDICYNGGTFEGYCKCDFLHEGYCCEKEKPRLEQPSGRRSCDDICTWSSWEEWSTCSVSCGGGGHQQRERHLCCLEEYGNFQNCAARCDKDIKDQVENRNCGDNCLYGGTLKKGDYGCQCLDRTFGHCCEELLSGCTPFPTDVIFVLDSSTSQTKDEFRQQLDFVLKFIDQVNISKEEFQITIATFSFEAKIEIHFNQSTNKNNLLDAINKISFRPGATFTNKGLNAALTVARQSERRKGMVTLTYAFVLTDGMSTKRQDTRLAAKTLRDHNVHVVAIGIGKEVSHKELIDIASPGDQHSPSYVFSVGDFNALDTLLKQLVDITCDDCSAVSHFSHIVFLLDESNDMTENEFEISVDILTSIVTNTDHVGEHDGPAFGLFQLGDTLENVIKLSKHQSQSGLTLNLRVLRRTRNDACSKDEQCNKMNMTNAIGEIVKNSYNISGRDNARNFLIILSNGHFEKPSMIKNEIANIKELADVKVFMVGLGSDIHMYGLLALAKEASHVFVTQDNSDHSNLIVMQSEFMYNICLKH